jgi:hypothetical protein
VLDEPSTTFPCSRSVQPATISSEVRRHDVPSSELDSDLERLADAEPAELEELAGSLAVASAASAQSA